VGNVTSPEPGSGRGRYIAITLDDLPVISMTHADAATRRLTTDGLLNALAAHRITAVGFVNEAALYRQGVLDGSQVALLRAWLERGHELGNHTHSHLDLHRVDVETYQQDVIAGERVLRSLLDGPAAPRWFRHPYLHTGRSLEAKRAVEAFLARRGYRVAPVTIFPEDHWFAAAYDWTRFVGRPAAAERVMRAYLDYLERTFDYCESMSVRLLGHEIPQVLLLHANALNAECLDRVADLLAARGYAFVTLEQALLDPAYGSEDTYAGDKGISWLVRWAKSRGLGREVYGGKPPVPGFVRRLARTPLRVALWRGARRLREMLYARFKKPLRELLRGLR